MFPKVFLYVEIPRFRSLSGIREMQDFICSPGVTGRIC